MFLSAKPNSNSTAKLSLYIQQIPMWENCQILTTFDFKLCHTPRHWHYNGSMPG